MSATTRHFGIGLFPFESRAAQTCFKTLNIAGVKIALPSHEAEICDCCKIGMPSAVPAWNRSAASGHMFMKFSVCEFLENLSRRLAFV